jgi:hypothetical protein
MPSIEVGKGIFVLLNLLQGLVNPGLEINKSLIDLFTVFQIYLFESFLSFI